MFFFFQAEDGIRDLVRSRGLGDVYKRQRPDRTPEAGLLHSPHPGADRRDRCYRCGGGQCEGCLLYTSDAADDLLCVDLGGRRIIKKKNTNTKKQTLHIYH
mgnify:CR=1 FL=1